MSKKIRGLMVKEIEKTFTKGENFIFAQYQGISANDVAELRNELAEKNVSMFVLKNSITEIVLKRLWNDDVSELLSGQTAVFYGTDDSVLLAKMLVETQKKRQFIKIAGGLCDGKRVSAGDIAVYAKLPSKQQMLASVAGTISAPLSSCVRGLAAILQSPVYAVKALSEKNN